MESRAPLTAQKMKTKRGHSQKKKKQKQSASCDEPARLSCDSDESVYELMQTEANIILRIEVAEGVEVTCLACDIEHSSILLGTSGNRA